MRSASQAVVVLVLSTCLLISVPAQTSNGGRSNGARPASSTAAEPVNGKVAPVSEMRASIER